MKIIVTAILLAALAGPAAAQSDPIRQVLEDLDASSVVVQDSKGGHGSGAVVSLNAEGAVILTAFHVVKDAKELKILQIAGEKIYAVPGRVLKISPEKDLALVQAMGLKAPTLAIAQRVRQYEQVHLWGAPFTQYGVMSTGRIIHPVLMADNLVAFMIGGAMVLPGCSGGAVVNDRGELVALTISILNYPLSGDIKKPIALVSVPQISFASPLDSIRTFLEGTPTRDGTL